MPSDNVPRTLASNFANGIIATPASLAAGMNQLLGSTGLYGFQAAEHHTEHLVEFLEFIKTVTLSGGIRQMVTHIVEEAFNEYPEETIYFVAQRIAFQGGRAAARQFLVNTVVQKLVSASAMFEQQAMARSSARSIAIVLGIASQVSHSGAAADRLKKSHPTIYNSLRRAKLIGGYYLVEDGVEPLLAVAAHIRDENDHEVNLIHQEIQNQL